MSWLPAVTRTRRMTRSNCARAMSQNTIAETSDAGFFISALSPQSSGARTVSPPTRREPWLRGTLSAADLIEVALALDFKVASGVLGTCEERPVGGVCRME